MQPKTLGRENTSTSLDKRGTGTTQTGLGQPDRLTDRTTFADLFQSEYSVSLHGPESDGESLGGIWCMVIHVLLGGNTDRRSQSTVAQGGDSIRENKERRELQSKVLARLMVTTMISGPK